MSVAQSSVGATPAYFQDFKGLLPLAKIEANLGAWSRQYCENEPFPHIGLDDFFDEATVETLVAGFPAPVDRRWKKASFDANHEAQKFSMDLLEDLPSCIRLFIEALNCSEFLRFLERLTGTEGLIADPYLSGGGLHMTTRGGRLGVHTDFNIHPQLGLDRRINLLLYLNAHWSPDWGGGIELWDRDVKTKVKSYTPLANRVVIFSTTDRSFHGHPDPVQCPRGEYRKSISMYYYSRGRPDEEASPPHTTQFKPSPQDMSASAVAGDFVRQPVPSIVLDVGRRLRSK